jgi:hypothetical protein
MTFVSGSFVPSVPGTVAYVSGVGFAFALDSGVVTYLLTSSLGSLTGSGGSSVSAVSGSFTVSSSVGAPPGSSYAVVAPDASLPSARALVAGPGIALADGGPGGQLVISEAQPFTSASHAALRQLVHLAGGGGPFETFGTAYSTSDPSPFPSSSIWWADAGLTKKIVEMTTVYNANSMPSTVTWKAYASDGLTVVATAVDAVTYTNGVFEASRIRTIT